MGEEKRRDPRVSVKLKVKLVNDSFDGEFYTVNVSRGGVFIETKNPFTLGDYFYLELFLTESEKISCNAKVVWVSHYTENSSYLPGMGLKFENLSLKDREKIGCLLGEILRREQEVDADMHYNLNERLVISSDDICETPAEVIAVLAGIGIRDRVSLTQEVLKNAGETLVKNYNLYGDDLEIGDAILVPYEGKLTNPYIILVGAPSFYDAFGEENLRNVMLGVLKMAKDQAFTSLAVPAFSFLEVGYPIQSVAKICLGTAYGFLKKEIFPRKIFFYCNYNNIQDFLVFEKIKKEIFLD